MKNNGDIMMSVLFAVSFKFSTLLKAHNMSYFTNSVWYFIDTLFYQ